MIEIPAGALVFRYVFTQSRSGLPGGTDTFYQDGKRVFWDVHNPEDMVVIELKDERYNELIVEVADPQGAVELVVKAALPR
jgi:hypothetical protein